MSASREKKARQERGAEYVSPKQQKALEEEKSARRSTAIFAVCAAAVVLFVAGLLVWNSGILQRNAAAVRVNGKTYSAADVSYYYTNTRASYANSGSIDTSTSLRGQSRSDGSTWFDYIAGQAAQSLASAEAIAQSAKDAGFDGGAEVDETVRSTLSSLGAAASSNGYGISGYLKAVFGSLMTRSIFERNLRTAALADIYTAAKADVANYSDAELTAVYDADPDAYAMVDYEYAIFSSANYAEETAEGDAEADDGSAAALAAAEEALARFQAGESLEDVAEDADAAYARATAYYGSAEIAEWLFDDARRDGDATVLDYTYYGVSLGSMTVVFHGKTRADFHPVDVRHILVSDEAAANDILAQFNAGDRSEASFAALAQVNSTDNADDGGLYANIYLGQMVKPFEDWCFDASRQPGDAGVVQTDYGYHVMYFVQTRPYSYWQLLAADKLADDWRAGLTENLFPEMLDGMKYIDPIDS